MAKLSPAAPRLYLCFDIGGTWTRAAIITSRGRLRGRHQVPTPRQPRFIGAAILQAFLLSVSRGALTQAGVDLAEVAAVGVAAPGPLNPESGEVYMSANLPGWQDVPLRRIAQEALGRPTVLGNDADAAALGEHRFGAGRGVANMIYITVSTGIGGGLILGGKLYRGQGMAGEVGHMTIEVDGPRCGCGSVGCWEALASGTALAREALDRLRGGARSSILAKAGGSLDRVDARAVHQAALEGDPLARELIGAEGHYLGVGLANLVNIFNPELIVLGGGLMSMGEMLLEPARRTLSLRAFASAQRGLRLELAGLGEDSGLLGAMLLARGWRRGRPL